MGTGDGKRPLAPHVAAALARGAQPKMATFPARPAQALPAPARSAQAAHVATAIGRGQGPVFQAKPAPPARLEAARSAPAAHVAAAIGRSGSLQAKPAFSAASPPPAPLPAARAAVPTAWRPPVVQRMEEYVDKNDNPSFLKIIEHEPYSLNNDLTFGKILELELDDTSDDDVVTQSVHNFYQAHNDLSSKFDKKRKLKRPPKTKAPTKKLKLHKTDQSQWKRVNTEYIGEVGGFHAMIEKGYKMGFSTGVLGGRGLDQVWYKGSVTDDLIDEVVVVECKGPGAKLSDKQTGTSSARLSREWVLDNAEIMSRSKDDRKKTLGTFICTNIDTRGKVKGLIIRHDQDGTRKIGRMHDF